MAISERIQLLSRYDDIPPEITISCILTEDELRYVGDESYIDLMLDVIFPKVVAEQIDFHSLLEVDFHWICRCLRILSFGANHTTNSIFCDSCHNTSYGEYKVNLNTVGCIPLPEDAPEQFMIRSADFIDFTDNVFFNLMTINDLRRMSKDPLFVMSDGKVDLIVGRLCYMITGFGTDINLTPIQVKHIIRDRLSSADYYMLKSCINEMADFGLRSHGIAQCPKCGSREAVFIALPDDRYYVRPWELQGNGFTINISGKERTYREVRQQMYENIIDETLFISRASESAVSADWLMTQPIFLRKKYVESFTKEIQERERNMKNKGKPRTK